MGTGFRIYGSAGSGNIAPRGKPYQGWVRPGPMAVRSRDRYGRPIIGRARGVRVLDTGQIPEGAMGMIAPWRNMKDEMLSMRTKFAVRKAFR